ncbi:hypothetical protein ACVWWR_005030 [Bradyrhizobium sp. LM3.2]
MENENAKGRDEAIEVENYKTSCFIGFHRASNSLRGVTSL